MATENNFFSKNLVFLRKQRKMTQAELGKKIDVDQTTIGRWEDANREPAMGNVINIANVFDVTIPDLLSKDLSLDDNVIDETDILFDKYKDHLTDSDKQIIKTIIEQRKKEIDNELGTNEE